MKCKAELHIADDYADNHATLDCELDEGHEGKHRETFRTDPGETPDARNVVVEWEGSDLDKAP